MTANQAAGYDYETWVGRVADAIHEACRLEWQAIAVVDPGRQVTQHAADAHYGMAHDLVRRLGLARDPATDTRAALHGLGDAGEAAVEGVGYAVRYWRRFAGLTLRDLGERTDADFTYLSKIENGHDYPSRKLIERIDAVTGAEGQLVEAWQGSRCPNCGHRAARLSRAADEGRVE